MASTLQAIASSKTSPKMEFEKIRKTKEKPYRVSVIDLIGAVTKNNNPSDDWKKLRTSHPEVIADSYDYDSDYKFPGRRQRETPVINAEGAILIINLLPGSMAASFRAAWANIIVRYIGGDMTLKAEVERNNALQKELHEDDPRAFCRQHVEYRGPKSVTGVQDIRSAQLYFGSAGPPENWLDIRRQDGSPYVLKEGEHIIKVGCHDHNTGRHGEHVREFRGFGVSDSILDENPSRLERGMKDHLRNENTLLSARHVNKTTRDTELFAANLEVYEAYVNKAIELASVTQTSGFNMDYERELTKRMEHETKRLESGEETKRAEIHANLEVQKMQIQLEMLRLQTNAERQPKEASVDRQAQISANEARRAEAEARISVNELKMLELRLKGQPRQFKTGDDEIPSRDKRRDDHLKFVSQQIMSEFVFQHIVSTGDNNDVMHLADIFSAYKELFRRNQPDSAKLLGSKKLKDYINTEVGPSHGNSWRGFKLKPVFVIGNTIRTSALESEATYVRLFEEF